MTLGVTEEIEEALEGNGSTIIDRDDPHIALFSLRHKIYGAFYRDQGMQMGDSQAYDALVLSQVYKIMEDILLPKLRAYANAPDPKSREGALALTYREVNQHILSHQFSMALALPNVMAEEWREFKRLSQQLQAPLTDSEQRDIVASFLAEVLKKQHSLQAAVDYLERQRMRRPRPRQLLTKVNRCAAEAARGEVSISLHIHLTTIKEVFRHGGDKRDVRLSAKDVQRMPMRIQMPPKAS